MALTRRRVTPDPSDPVTLSRVDDLPAGIRAGSTMAS
jgi:hypothetical protein